MASEVFLICLNVTRLVDPGSFAEFSFAVSFSFFNLFRADGIVGLYVSDKDGARMAGGNYLHI